jgi:GNAT superfamily N-acetyltransferase
MTIEITRVTDLDAVWPELTTLLEELHEHHQPFWPRDFMPDWQVRWRHYLEAGDDRCILLARDGRAPVGYVNGAIRRNPSLFVETYGYIDDAYVRPAARRQGAGAGMLQQFEDWCRSRGVDEVRLGVVAANEVGVNFWVKSGFAPLTYTMSKRLVPA